MENNSWIVFDGKIIPSEKPVVPAVSRGLMYGDGVFETFRTYSAQTLFLDDHLKRLSNGLDVLGISKPAEIEIHRLRSLVYKLLQKQQLAQQDAIVRLQVWRDGQRGYSPDKEANTHFSITASACPDSFSPPKLVTVDRKRIPSASLPSEYKFTNGINYILAARKAAESGCDDALMQTVEGKISETTIANIFWAKGTTIFTPSDNCDLIPGITRNFLKELIAQNKDWELQQGQFTLEDLSRADAVWMCNSVREVLPVEKVDNHTFDVKYALLSELKKQFKQFRDTNLKPLDI